MRDPPEPKLLTTLLAVVRHGSMTAAAAALGYVPSAASQQITRLERQSGSGMPESACSDSPSLGKALVQNVAQVPMDRLIARRTARRRGMIRNAGRSDFRVGRTISNHSSPPCSVRQRGIARK